jgi:hypothetical protein
MFENCTKQLSNGIYLYNNFISELECKIITEYLDSLNENDWHKDPSRKDNIKFSIDIELVDPIREKIDSLTDKDHFLGKGSSVTRMLPGDWWGVHEDVHNFYDTLKKSSKYVDGMPYKEERMSFFGTVLYFNSVEGGEIFYPKQNITHKPQPGDLIIHGASRDTIHGVNRVIKGKRYSYSNSIRRLVKIPV